MLTDSPPRTRTSATVPSAGAKISFSIFMASRSRTRSPALTTLPTETLTSSTLPGMGAAMAEPPAETGAAAFGAAGAAGADTGAAAAAVGAGTAAGAAGALTGAASLWLPVLPGNGRDALEAALASPATGASLVALAGVMVLKPLLTGLTLGAGATGGLLAPSFALGGSAGAAVAGLAHLAGWEASVPVLALVGAGTVLAITQRAPVFGTLFVWELVRPGLWVLVLMAVVVVVCWWPTSSPRPLLSRPPSRCVQG